MSFKKGLLKFNSSVWHSRRWFFSFVHLQPPLSHAPAYPDILRELQSLTSTPRDLGLLNMLLSLCGAFFPSLLPSQLWGFVPSPFRHIFCSLHLDSIFHCVLFLTHSQFYPCLFYFPTSTVRSWVLEGRGEKALNGDSGEVAPILSPAANSKSHQRQIRNDAGPQLLLPVVQCSLRLSLYGLSVIP